MHYLHCQYDHIARIHEIGYRVVDNDADGLEIVHSSLADIEDMDAIV